MSLIFRYGQMMTRCFLASSVMCEIQVFVSKVSIISDMFPS